MAELAMEKVMNADSQNPRMIRPRDYLHANKSMPRFIRLSGEEVLGQTADCSVCPGFAYAQDTDAQ
jgi:hypothetical protein